MDQIHKEIQNYFIIVSCHWGVFKVTTFRLPTDQHHVPLCSLPLQRCCQLTIIKTEYVPIAVHKDIYQDLWIQIFAKVTSNADGYL